MTSSGSRSSSSHPECPMIRFSSMPEAWLKAASTALLRSLPNLHCCDNARMIRGQRAGTGLIGVMRVVLTALRMVRSPQCGDAVPLDLQRANAACEDQIDALIRDGGAASRVLEIQRPREARSREKTALTPA